MTDTEILALLREVRGETRTCPHEGEEDGDCDCLDAVRVAQLDAAIAELKSRTADADEIRRDFFSRTGKSPDEWLAEYRAGSFPDTQETNEIACDALLLESRPAQSAPAELKKAPR